MSNVGSVSFTLEANKKGFKSATKGLRDVEKGVKNLLNAHTKSKGRKTQRAFTPRQSMMQATQRQADIDKGMKKIRTLSAGRGLKNKARGSIARLEALGNAGVKQIKKVKAAMKEVSAAAKDETPAGDLRRAVAAFDLNKRIDKADRKVAKEKAKQDAIKKTEQAEKKAAAEAAKAEKDKAAAIKKSNAQYARQAKAIAAAEERAIKLAQKGKEVGASPQQMAAVTRALNKYKKELKDAGDDTRKAADAQIKLNNTLNNTDRLYTQMRKVQGRGGKLSAEQAALNAQNKARAVQIKQVHAQRRAMQKLLQLAREAGASAKQTRTVTQAFRAWRLETRAANGDLTKLTQAEAKLANTTARLGREFKNLKAASAGRGISKLALRMRNMESASILAVGPLSGIGARIRSLGAISGRSSLKMAALIGSFTGLAVGAYKVIKAGVMVNREMEKMNARFEVSAGSSFLARREMAHLVKVTTKYGVAFQETSRGYSRFVAAAAAGNIELSVTRQLMESVVKAGAALKLTGYDMEGIFRAFEQIVSKGTVSSEELRNQLGDRLTGALQIAAKGYETNVAGLLKMIKAGEVYATDFLPKMSRAIDETYGHKAADNVKTFSGLINILTNQFKIFAGGAAEDLAVMKALKLVLGGTVAVLEKLNNLTAKDMFEKMTDEVGKLRKEFKGLVDEYDRMHVRMREAPPEPEFVTHYGIALSVLQRKMKETAAEHERQSLVLARHAPGTPELIQKVKNYEQAIAHIQARIKKVQDLRDNRQRGWFDVGEDVLDKAYDRQINSLQEAVEKLQAVIKETRGDLKDLFDQAGKDTQGRFKSRRAGINAMIEAMPLQFPNEDKVPDPFEKRLRFNADLTRAEFGGKHSLLRDWFAELEYDPAKAEKLADTMEDIHKARMKMLRDSERVDMIPDKVQLLEAEDALQQYFKAFKKGSAEYRDVALATKFLMVATEELIAVKREAWRQEQERSQDKAIADLDAQATMLGGQYQYYKQVTAGMRDYEDQMKKIVGEGEILNGLMEKQSTLLNKSYDAWHKGQTEAFAMSIAMDNMNDSMKDLPEIDQKFYEQYVIPFMEGSKVIQAFAKDADEAKKWIEALQKALTQRFENNLGRELKALAAETEQIADGVRAAQQGEFAQAWHQQYVVPLDNFTKRVLASTKDITEAQDLIARRAEVLKLKFEVEYEEEKLKRLKEYIDDFEHKTLMIRVQTQIEGLSDYDRSLWQQVVLPYQEASRALVMEREKMLKYYQDKGLSPEEIAKLLPSDAELGAKLNDRLKAYFEAFDAKDQTPKFTALKDEIAALNAETQALAAGSKAYEQFRHIEGPVMQRRLELMSETGGLTDLTTDEERELNNLRGALQFNNEAIKQFERTQAVTDALTRGFTDMTIKGREFADVLKNIVALMAQMVLRSIFEPIAGGIAGFLTGGLFGARYGMQAKVTGGGSPDSRVAAFRVSPNETIDVRTPAQQKSLEDAIRANAGGMHSGSGDVISIVSHNDFSGADPGSVDQILSYIDVRDAQTVNRVQDALSRKRIGYGRRRGRV